MQKENSNSYYSEISNIISYIKHHIMRKYLPWFHKHFLSNNRSLHKFITQTVFKRL